MLDMPFYEDTFVRINIVEGELNEREREEESYRDSISYI